VGVSRRPLVFVLGLTLGDYLLWNWSLNGNHDVIALVAGLTLPPLAVVAAWLLAMSTARLLAGIARRPARTVRRGRQRRRGITATGAAAAPAAATGAVADAGEAAITADASDGARSRRLAA